MALRYCTGCTTRFAVGLPRCPWCGSREHVEEGEQDMAKITVHGGPSNAAADEQAAPAAVGSEGPSASSSSETSSEKEPTSPAKSEKRRPSRAPKTGSRSGRAQTATSTARSTDGGQADAESATSSTSDEAGE